MGEAETRALQAMVERGRGILLVCAPVAGGSTTTYYALLAHAAASGKTVYSVEQSIEYEIAAVAQVMVEPGGPSPAAYIAAGMRQDTDVIAIDGLRTVEDVHFAVEAAGLGKLVIATFPAADIASGVRRMLDLGAEPHSLAAALTLGVGQRLVRLNCPNCSVETDGALAARIPGAPAGLRDQAGSGCPNCGKTGFKGATAIHEVLPFTEPVRATVGRGASDAEIAAAAAAAGMRPLLISGLARVKSGDVSAEELNRVLRFVNLRSSACRGRPRRPKLSSPRSCLQRARRPPQTSRPLRPIARTGTRGCRWKSSVLAQAVTFRLEGQIYGLPLAAVQEIQQLVEFTPLPDSAPALVGTHRPARTRGARHRLARPGRPAAPGLHARDADGLLPSEGARRLPHRGLGGGRRGSALRGPAAAVEPLQHGRPHARHVPAVRRGWS